MSTTLKLDKRGKLRLTEADVTRQCIDFLRAERWMCIRQHVGVFIPLAEQEKSDPNVIAIGEKGDPDWLILKNVATPLCRLFYLELKRPGGRVRAWQRLKHEALRVDGYRVCVAHGLDELRGWMAEYGL